MPLSVLAFPPLFVMLLSSSPTEPVVLGSVGFGLPDARGWGTVAPAEIFNGGAPSGLVSEIHWTDWGSPTSTGVGRGAIYRPGGGYYGELVRIELRAQRLGRCTPHGPPAYTELMVRAPSRPGGPMGPWTRWANATTLCVLSPRPA